MNFIKNIVRIFKNSSRDPRDFILDCPELSSVTDKITEDTYHKIIEILNLNEENIDYIFNEPTGRIKIGKN